MEKRKMTTVITKDRRGKNVYKVLRKPPNRDTVINNDDILNLKIALETSKTFEEFLRRV